LDAYLEEELYDLLTYCIQNRQAPEFAHKKCRVQEIGRELYADSGADALENMFFSIERGVKEEMGQEVRPYRAWWNGITAEWKYKDGDRSHYTANYQKNGNGEPIIDLSTDLVHDAARSVFRLDKAYQ
jgi:hypothetical protein